MIQFSKVTCKVTKGIATYFKEFLSQKDSSYSQFPRECLKYTNNKSYVKPYFTVQGKTMLLLKTKYHVS